MNIFLIGPRASGKTRVGRLTAERLGADFVDADAAFAAKWGGIADFVAKEGWEEFRRRESEILRIMEEPGRRVLATGGGIVLAAANREFMRGAGRVFYLRAPAEILATRLSLDPLVTQRPSLTGKGLLAEIAEVLAQREELYCQTAHHILNAVKPPEEVAAAIITNVGE